MKRLAAVLSEKPGLVTWLRSGVWRKGFDRGSLSRAEQYLDRILMPDILNKRGGSVECDVMMRGSGTSVYETRVVFIPREASWFLDSDCSCPVGIFCKHGAALILALLRELPGFAAPTGTNLSPAQVQLDPAVLRWLERMSSTAKTLESDSGAEKIEPRFLAYCLKRGTSWLADDTWYLSLRVGQRKKSGFSIPDTMANADPSNPPKYMVREDFIPAALYHQQKRKMGAWEALRCEGEGWDEMLDSMAATGRLYFWDERVNQWKSLSEGPDLPVTPGWTGDENGGTKPVLEFDDGIARSVLPVNPPYYLDPGSGSFGRLVSRVPSGILGSWLSGPRISAAQMESVSARLSAVSKDLPRPVQVEKIDLPGIAPVPHLRIVRKKFQRSNYAPELIGAELRFRYGDGPLLDPLSSAKEAAFHSEMRGGKILIQPRLYRAEKLARETLSELGMIPLPQAFPSAAGEPGLNSVFLLSDSIFAHDPERWHVFLEGDGLGALKEAGWKIEVVRESGLFVREAGEIFAHLEEEPGHGIDWFRFDAEFELEGQKVSMIPIIAHAIRMDLPPSEAADLPEYIRVPAGKPEDGMIRFPAKRLLEFVDQVRHLFQGRETDGPVKIDKLAAAGVADVFGMDRSETLRSLAALSKNLRNISGLPQVAIPGEMKAQLRDYQSDGFRWLRFLADHGLNGILADDMGLGKTLQTLAHIAAEKERGGGLPSLVIAPTSVVPNWMAEAEKFTPHLKVIMLHGKERTSLFGEMAGADLVITSYALAHRDVEVLAAQDWHLCALDEAQYIKNSKAVTTRSIRRLNARHRLCLSGTPMENHLGELWSLMHFLMPGFLGDESHFNTAFRRPIERDRSSGTQRALNRRLAPLILRRTKDQVAKELPAKTEILHTITLSKKQTDLYESVRAAMDKRVRDAIADKGLAKSHIIVLDALLKLRQICCHPPLLKTAASAKADSAKLDFLMEDLLPTLVEEGRRILLFSSFTTMLDEIAERLPKLGVPFLMLTGNTRNRAELVSEFQLGKTPVFLISLKAGGTGLNLTAADTVIHYDPWWNPAAENQATDRAHRIGQVNPVFVHKLICGGSVEERIIELQKHKAALVQALLAEETSKLKIDKETLSHLLAPLGGRGL